jgi:hypothetical protein
LVEVTARLNQRSDSVWFCCRDFFQRESFFFFQVFNGFLHVFPGRVLGEDGTYAYLELLEFG